MLQRTRNRYSNGRITALQMSSTLSAAIQRHEISNEDTATLFYDLSYLEERIRHLLEVFPVRTLHAIAAKANPLPSILRINAQFGVGVEAATMGEVYNALRCGYEPSRIVFDSPAKTRDEIAYALVGGIHINADSFDELDRIDALLKTTESSSNIGLRINPQIGSGSINTTNVAEKHSKFGVPIDEFEDQIVDYYERYPWLNGIHMHVGSQGCSLSQLTEAAKRLVSIIKQIEDRIRYIDIGGGMPVQYKEVEPAVSMEEYVRELRAHCPTLFEERFSLITEFGRYVHANSGWTAARVEYVKTHADVNTAIIHVGADLLLRRCYEPQFWHHEFSVCDRAGRLRSTEDTQSYTIAGPLCFGSDIVARDVQLPRIREGDFLLVHDTGGYTLSMWSRYTSRQIPKVLGYRRDGRQFETLKKRESLEDVFRFWQ